MTNINNTTNSTNRDIHNNNREFRGIKRNYQDKFSESDFKVEVLQVRRVSNTKEGGRKMSFSAYVAIGDGSGTIGIGSAKALEVPDAIRKAEDKAKKKLLRIPTTGKTIIHDTEGKCGATSIVLKKAKKGTGFVTCNVIKIILRLGGLEDVVCKVYGSSTTHNIINALLDAIKNNLETPKRIALRRDKNLSDILIKKDKNIKKENIKKDDNISSNKTNK